MKQIELEIFQKSMDFWRIDLTGKPVSEVIKKFRESVKFLSYSTFCLDPNSENHILGLDHFSMKAFIIEKNKFWQVHFGMKYLINHDVHFREGFVDKSLNTELFSKVEKFKFIIGEFEFEYKEFDELANALCTPNPKIT